VVSPQSLQENVGIVPRLGYDLFLPGPFQFAIHLQSIVSTECHRDADSVAKVTTTISSTATTISTTVTTITYLATLSELLAAF
jgi:hypothetical protein